MGENRQLVMSLRSITGHFPAKLMAGIDKYSSEVSSLLFTPRRSYHVCHAIETKGKDVDWNFKTDLHRERN